MSNIIVLGIAGGSGSGKTTLMKNLIARFQDDVTVLSHDNYYRPYDELTIEERRKLNYDHPDAFDTDMMIGNLKELKAGHSIECPSTTMRPIPARAKPLRSSRARSFWSRVS